MCINLGIETNGTLGGAGACLLVTGFVSAILSILGLITNNNLMTVQTASIFAILSFLGFGFYCLAIFGLSRDYKDRQVFRPIRNSLLIIAILYIPSLIAIALIPHDMSGKTVTIFLLLVLVVYNYKTVKLLAEKTGIRILRTAGKLLILATVIDTAVLITLAVLYYAMGINYLTIGALLSPGIFISNVAWGLTAKGFFALQPPAKSIIQDQPNQRQILFCPNCGTSTQPNQTYCGKCGTKLE